MKKSQLVFVPSPGAGHLASAVEAAMLLLDRDDRFSAAFLIMKQSFDTKVSKYINSLRTSDRLQFINLPPEDSESIGLAFIEKYKPHIKDAVIKLDSLDNSCLAGFVLDMFCTPVMDVANEFGLPSYVFFTSGAAVLGLMFHLLVLHDEHEVDLTGFDNSDAELALPSLAIPLPARALPYVILDRERTTSVLGLTRRLGEARGIIVNTFTELESHALNSFADGKFKAPPLYPVGPILNLKGGDDVKSESEGSKEIIEWLDDQPSSSVVFLCFGSMGGFHEDQAKEIASALEKSGHRFLWSLRQPSPMGKRTESTDYENFEEILPVGFSDRTAGIGKIIGWAPQVAVLAHPAVGSFVSHCGWNSILESIWHGVPIATWPMYAEQQFNAFEMVKELGLAVEITMVYRKDNPVTVRAEDIERGIMRVMQYDSETRRKIKDMRENGRKALMDGGSSLSSLNRFIEDVISSIP